MSCPVDCPVGNAAASIFSIAATVNLHECLQILPLMGWQDSGATAALPPWDFCTIVPFEIRDYRWDWWFPTIPEFYYRLNQVSWDLFFLPYKAQAELQLEIFLQTQRDFKIWLTCLIICGKTKAFLISARVAPLCLSRMCFCSLSATRTRLPVCKSASHLQ